VRIFFQELGAQCVVAGLENLLDVLGHAVADAGEGGELFGIGGEGGNAFRETVD